MFLPLIYPDYTIEDESCLEEARVPPLHLSVYLSPSSHIRISEERPLVSCLPYICSPNCSCASTKRHLFWRRATANLGIWENCASNKQSETYLEHKY